MGFLENLKDNLANARAQVDELHVIGDRRHHVDHVVDKLEACLAVHPGGERLIVVQLVRVADHIVVDLHEKQCVLFDFRNAYMKSLDEAPAELCA